MVAASAFATALACGGADGPGKGAPQDRVALRDEEPHVTRVGGITLRETDSLYVARPSGIAVDPLNGDLYVTDGFWGRVLRFTASGELAATYGVRGEGPGELKDPGAVAVGNSLVFVADVGTGRVGMFETATGRFVRAVRHRGALSSLLPLGDGVWMGVQNVTGKTALARAEDASDTLVYSGALPEEFVMSPPLAGIYTGIQVLSWGDTVVAGFMGLNRVVRYHSDGTVLDSIRIPVRIRRGEIPNVVQALGRMEFPQQFSANSALFRMHRLSGGSLALIHYDQEIDGNLIRAKVFLSLLSPDFRQACVDRVIPVSEDAQPYTAFAGNELFVLQQKVDGERAHTFVDRYRIDEAGCFGRA